MTRAVWPLFSAAQMRSIDRHTLDSLRWAEAHADWVAAECLWVFRYPYPTLSYPDNFTFANTIFQLQPIYYAVQAYARGFPDQAVTWLDAPAG